MTTLRAGGLTDVGRVRSVNQDRVYFDDSLFAIADGMGGHAGGEVAATTAIEVLRRSFSANSTEGGLVEAVRTANLAVWEQARSDADLHGMGTTITAAAVVSDSGAERLALVNVGDSRAYLFRNGALRQLTEDHSVVEEMVRAGELSEGEAAVHPSRHILTRALGVEPSVEVDRWSIVPLSGDRFLLCSDGLINEVGDSEITSVLARQQDPQTAADELVRLARAHGGSDNITVLVIDVTEWSSGGDATGAATGAAVAGTPLSNAAGATLARVHGGGSDITMAVPVVSPDTTGLHAPADTPPPPGSGAAAEPAEEAPPTARPGGPGEPATGKAPSRRVTFRVVLFLVLVAAVVIGAVLVVRWFANRSYFVGLDHSQIVIYRGQPGGTLWFQPQVVQRTGLTTDSVLPGRVPDLQHGTEEPSLDAARRYISNLTSEARSLPAQNSPANPATTVPAAETTPARLPPL